MTILRNIKRILNHSFLDKILRTSFNFFYKTKHSFFPSTLNIKIKNIAFFCYGGMGDILLSFPMLIKLSKYFNVHIFIEDKFHNLSKLLSNNCYIYSYRKDNLFSVLYKFRKKKIPDLLFIQQSPIFELILFKLIIKANSSIGFVFSHKIINTINLPEMRIKHNILNKLEGYELIFTEIKSLYKSKPKLIKKYKLKKYQTSLDRFNLNFKFFTISVSKDPQWEMGGIKPEEYSRAITEIHLQTNFIPIFLGTNDDITRIRKVLNFIPKKIKYLNFVGKTNLDQLIEILQKTEFTIANDNGIHHLSNFLNKKTITLFNFSSPLVYKWHNKNSYILYRRKYECMPCISKPDGPWDNVPFKCPFNIKCQNSLNANDILKVFKKIELKLHELKR